MALRAAGAVLASPTSRYRTIPAYLRALSERTTSVLADRPDVSDPDVARRLVGYTWDLSLEQLATDGVTLATPLLRLLSQFTDAPVPRSLLTPDLLTAATGEDTTLAAVDAAVAGLHRYGLIDTPEPARTLNIPTVALHPVVRESTALRLSHDGHRSPFRDAVDHALTAGVRDVTQAGRGGWDTAQLLAPHLPTLHNLTTTDQPFLTARNTLDDLARVLYAAGRHPSELALRQHVLDTEEHTLGPDHPDTLSSRNNLASALDGLGRYQEAADLHRDTLTTREHLLGPNHPSTLSSRNNLASALYGLGRYQEAADLHRDTLTTREHTLGPNHPDTLSSRNNLANALAGLGRFQEAADLHRDTLTTLENILGPDQPTTLQSRNNLANALARLGRYQEAADLHRDTLTTREHILGPDHPTTLQSRNNLAGALRGLGRYREAADLHRDTLTTLERILGPDHPDTLQSRNNLALALRAAGAVGARARWWRWR